MNGGKIFEESGLARKIMWNKDLGQGIIVKEQELFSPLADFGKRGQGKKLSYLT